MKYQIQRTFYKEMEIFLAMRDSAWRHYEKQNSVSKYWILKTLSYNIQPHKRYNPYKIVIVSPVILYYPVARVKFSLKYNGFLIRITIYS